MYYTRSVCDCEGIISTLSYIYEMERELMTIFFQRFPFIQAYRHCLVATTGEIMTNRTFGSPSFHDILPAHAKHTLTPILTVLVHDMW